MRLPGVVLSARTACCVLRPACPRKAFALWPASAAHCCFRARFSHARTQTPSVAVVAADFRSTPKKTAEQQFLICGSMFGGASVDVRILGVVV